MSSLLVATSLALTLAGSAGPVGTATASARAPSSAEDFGWVFAAPEPHGFSLGVGLGVSALALASSDTAFAPFLRAAVSRRIGDWLAAGLVVDWTHDADQSAALEVSNTRVLLGARAGLSRWVSRFRFELAAEGGPQLELSTLSDGSEVTHGGVRVRPAAGVTAGVGVSVRGVSLIQLLVVRRWEPRRSQTAIVLGVEWLLGAE